MKVLVNTHVGGMFLLSRKVLRRLYEKDHPKVRYLHVYDDYALKDANDPEVRTDPVIIRTVKEVGLEESEGEFCELAIKDATPPFAIHAPQGEEVIIEYGPLIDELVEKTTGDKNDITDILKRHLHPHYFYDSYINETYGTTR